MTFSKSFVLKAPVSSTNATIMTKDFRFFVQKHLEEIYDYVFIVFMGALVYCYLVRFTFGILLT